jgi:hypothetical protein
MDYLSCCPLLLVVSGADRVLAGQRLSCPGTAVGSASHTGSTGSRWEVIMNVVVGRSAAGQETAGEAVPEFYVALEFTGDGRCCRPGLPSAPLTEVVVRVTATGTALAAISAPRPCSTFTGVTAAADHRTFVLAAQKPARLPLTTPPVTRFFLLRVDPASPVPAGRARLEPLAIPEQPPGRVVSGLAVSPDASRLAVTVGPFPGATGLHVFTLATGVRRVWDGPAVGPAFGPGAVHGCLSWAADGHTLALISSGAPSPDRGVRLLDTAAPGSSLLASSRLVLPTPAGPENSSGNYWRQVLISAGSQVIIAVIQVEAHHASGRMPGVTQKLVTFSATTGTLLRELNHLPVHSGYEHVPWASPSGQLLIVTGTQPGPAIGSFNLGHSAGTLSQGRFTPIPWSTRTFAAAW